MTRTKSINSSNSFHTSIKTTQNKVKNTKATYNTGKNKSAESLMKRSFEPLFSPKDGKARLTFCGVQHSMIEWTDNSGKHRDKPIMKLAFSCLDTTHECPATIGITCEYRLSEKNRLGQVLAIMGYSFKDDKQVIDEDDEYGIQTKQVNPTEIFDFLRTQCGLVFKGNLKPVIKTSKKTGEVYESSLWNIDYKTLEPKILKTGEQERDMMSSDISDDDFQNPDIAMASESD
ncbi:MAG: hypothetical protein PUP93_25770 [Rhizonema sp. NSF051]|nr:hypothetical protein [Rhizonema sp. NSF051]